MAGPNGLDSFAVMDRQLAQAGTGTTPESTPLQGSSVPSSPENYDATVVSDMEASGVAPQFIEAYKRDAMSNAKFTQGSQARSKELSGLRESNRYLQGQLQATQQHAVANTPSAPSELDAVLDKHFPSDTEDGARAHQVLKEMFAAQGRQMHEATVAAMNEKMAPTQNAVAQSNLRAAETQFYQKAVGKYGEEVKQYWPQMWQSSVDGMKQGIAVDPERYLTDNHFQESLRMGNAAVQKSLANQKPGLEAHTRPAQGRAPIALGQGGGLPKDGDKPEVPPTSTEVWNLTMKKMREQHPELSIWEDI